MLVIVEMERQACFRCNPVFQPNLYKLLQKGPFRFKMLLAAPISTFLLTPPAFREFTTGIAECADSSETS